MPTALTGIASCARCGAAVGSSSDLCPSCGTTLVAPAPGTVVGTYAPLSTGLVRASPARRRWATALDAVPVVGLWVTGLVAVLTDRADGLAGIALVGALAGYLIANTAALTLRGRSLGRKLLRLRTVDDLTAMPVSLGARLNQLSAAAWTPRTITADLRRGRDPLDLALAPLPPNALAEGADQDAALFSLGGAVERGPGEAPDAVGLILDSGQRQVLHDSLLIGRSPENKDLGGRGRRHPTLAVADLSRTLAKTHVLLEWSGSVLWVTDLHSAHGSTLISPTGERRTLVPGLRGPAGIGWTISCGQRTLTVHAVASQARPT